jgi:hypothetical protein
MATPTSIGGEPAGFSEVPLSDSADPYITTVGVQFTASALDLVVNRLTQSHPACDRSREVTSRSQPTAGAQARRQTLILPWRGMRLLVNWRRVTRQKVYPVSP